MSARRLFNPQVGLVFTVRADSILTVAAALSAVFFRELPVVLADPGPAPNSAAAADVGPPGLRSASANDYYHGGRGFAFGGRMTYMSRAEDEHFTLPDRQTMLEKLGDDYNPNWMSIDRPRELENNGDGQVRQTAQPVNMKLYRQLTRHVNFTYQDHSTGLYHPLKPSVRKYVERWLLERASCPVRLSWDDVGPFFWPRWILQGECGSSRRTKLVSGAAGIRHDADEDPDPAEQSCSWPPGMRCVPEASQTIHLLRRQCRNVNHRRKPRSAPLRRSERSDEESPSATPTGHTAKHSGGEDDHSLLRRQHQQHRALTNASTATAAATTGYLSSPAASKLSERMRCRWKKVPYPITTGCFCSC